MVEYRPGKIREVSKTQHMPHGKMAGICGIIAGITALLKHHMQRFLLKNSKYYKLPGKIPGNKNKDLKMRFKRLFVLILRALAYTDTENFTRTQF